MNRTRFCCMLAAIILSIPPLALANHGPGTSGGASASRQTGSFAQSTITAAGIARGLPVNATCTLAATNNCNFNGVQGFNTSYALTPPRTYGVEFQYRF